MARSHKAIAVVGARLNSSRLPEKHLLELAGRPLIERLFERLDRCRELQGVVLATTSDAYNAPLVEWAESCAREVYAYEGDVNDLMERVEAVVRVQNASIVVYVCGDSPLVEPSTIDRMVRALRTTADGDIAMLATQTGRRYIHEGFAVYSRPFWARLVAASKDPASREHVGSAMGAVGEYRTIAVEDAPVFTETDHRISVDTIADYLFMRAVYERWYRTHDGGSIVDLQWVIRQLQQDTALARLNAHVRQRRAGETSAQALFLVAADISGQGLGRSVIMARALQEHASAGVQVWVATDAPLPFELSLLPHRRFPNVAAMLTAADGVAPLQILDLPWSRLVAEEIAALRQLAGKAHLVGVGLPPAMETLLPAALPADASDWSSAHLVAGLLGTADPNQ